VARLARINIHPVKSLDAYSAEQAVLLPSGALAGDRRYALRDLQGEFVNGKRMPDIHRLRSTFDPETGRLSIRVEGSYDTLVFDPQRQRGELSRWLGGYFGIPLEVIENSENGFPDDTESPGPTLVSISTLTEIAGWFAGLTLDDVRQRFRANLEIDGVEAFWEDRLVADASRVVRFRIGDAVLEGTNPCQRCIVPTRSPRTGEMMYGFAKRFAEHRQQQLPSWAPASRFDHFYRLALNTRGVENVARTIRVGDEISIVSGD
jgi:uncharacterized protein